MDWSRGLTDLPSLIAIDDGPCSLQAGGAWTLGNVERLERLCQSASRRPGAIDVSGVTALDTVGAWLFEKLARQHGRPSGEADFLGASVDRCAADAGAEPAPAKLRELRHCPCAAAGRCPERERCAGHLTAARIFERSVPIEKLGTTQAAAAFSQAFDALARDVVIWTVSAR